MSDINDFGDTKNSNNKTGIKFSVLNSADSECDKQKDIISPNQWTYVSKDSLISCTQTEKRLSPGYYEIISTQGQIIFKKKEIITDQLIEFPDSLVFKILQEIDLFWGLKEKFKRYGSLHRRGYMFYGPPGSGKTCAVHLINQKIINKGDVIFECKNPKILTKALEIFRAVEPDRKIVCIYEDIDSIIRDYGDDELLALLDGENLVDEVLNIATTNYPELLDKRLVGRPRRFDRVYKIDMPSRIQRELYFQHKLLPEDQQKIPLKEWIDKTEGFSFAALAELIISVLCLDNNFDEMIEVLRKLIFKEVSSSDYRNKKTGFN